MRDTQARLDKLVDRAQRRLWWQRLERQTTAGLRLALGFGVILLGADRLWRLRFEPWWVIGTGLALAVLAGVALAWRRRISRLGAAATLDERLHLAERLSSALALRGSDHPLVARLWADAEDRAAGINLRQALPWPRDTELRTCLVLLALLIGVALLPRCTFWRSETDVATELVSRQIGKELAEIAEEVAASAEERNAEAAKQAAREVLRQALALRQGRLSKEEALRRLEQASQQVDEARQALAGRPVPRTAREVQQALAAQGGHAAKLSEALAQQAFDQARRQLEALQQQLQERMKTGELTADELRQVAQQLQQMAQAMQGSAYGKQAEALAQAAQQLAQAAEAAAQAEAAGQSGQPAQAAQAAAAEAMAHAQQAMGQAAQSMSELSATDMASQAELDQLLESTMAGKQAMGAAERLAQDGESPTGLAQGNGGQPTAGSQPGQAEQANDRAGQAGRGFGPGSTNEAASGGRDSDSVEQQADGQSPADNRRADYERLYAPRRTDTNMTDQRSPGMVGPGGRSTATSGPTQAPQLDDARVPYADVLDNYQAEADDALSRGDIPLTERQRVKRYFDALQGSSATAR